MSISLTRVFLPILMVLAFLVRWEPTRTLHLAPDERVLGASRWLIDDPDTCQHMRRIELALATDKVVSFDRFVNYPAGGEIPALPLYDTLVAGIAQRFLRSPTGDVALGQVDEADLEDLGVKLAPILGLLMVLATWMAARNVVSGPRGDVAALVAAAVVALYPACVSVSSAGTLAPISLACVLFALLIRSTVRCVSAEAMPGALLDAMVGGALAGTLCTCTSLGLVLVAPAWIALFVHALRSEGEARGRIVRAGLIFCLVAAFLARMPLNEGPWEEGAGIMRSFASGVSMLLFLSTGPFILMLLLARNEKQRAFGTLCLVAGLVLMAWQLPQLWRDVSPVCRWYASNFALIQDVAPLVHSDSIVALLVLLLTSGMTVVWIWHDRRRPATFALLLFSLISLAVACVVGSAMPLAVVAAACALARSIDLAWVSEDAGQRRAALKIAVGVVVLLVANSSMTWAKGADHSLREERIEMVAGLRWMRSHTDSGGAWNAPRGTSSWGVMSPIELGALVEYHARRPALVSPWSVFSGPREVENAARSWFPDTEHLAHYMRGQQARYVVLPWRNDRRRTTDAVAMRTLKTDSLGGSVLWEGSPSVDPSSRSREGPFELVYASSRTIDARGHALVRSLQPSLQSQPVVEIWRLDAQKVAPPTPSFSPR